MCVSIDAIISNVVLIVELGGLENLMATLLLPFFVFVCVFGRVVG